MLKKLYKYRYQLILWLIAIGALFGAITERWEAIVVLGFSIIVLIILLVIDRIK